MKKKAKCTVLAILGVLGMFGVCVDNVSVALVGMFVAILCFNSIAAIDPEWGIEYDSKGKMIE